MLIIATLSVSDTYGITCVTPTVNISGGGTIYQGGYASLSASGASTYTWSPTASLSASTGTSVIATPTTTTTYTVIGAVGSCTSSATVVVSVTPVISCGSWNVEGGTGFTAGGANRFSFTLSSSGTPYMTYNNSSTGFYANAMKYNGSSWQNIGASDFSSSWVNEPVIAVNSSGTPYVFYSDGTTSKGNVRKFDGESWVSVGGANFTTGGVSAPSIAIDASGTPYIAFRDAAFSGTKATVMKFDGTNWVNVGSAGFSTGSIYSIDIKLHGSIPYVAYWDAANGNKATVMKFDGSNWVAVGSVAFSEGAVQWPCLAISSSGTLYVGYQDQAIGSRATVKTFDGTNWVTVGSRGFSGSTIDLNSIALDGSGTPYVAYRSSVPPYPASVMRFNGTSWVVVGSENFTPGQADFPSIAINSSGAVYVAYIDGSASSKVTMQKLTVSVCPITGTTTACIGTTTTLTSATAGGTWSSGDPSVATIDGSGVVTGQGAGTATIVYAALSQTTTTVVTVNQAPYNTSAASTTPALCNGGSTGSVTPHVAGTAPLTWIWSNGSTLSSLTNVPAGAYTYTVSNSCSSTATGTANVTQPGVLSASNTVSPVLCYGGSTGSVSVTATGGTSPYTGTGNFTGKSVGTYTYGVTDANGCTASTSATVTQPASALSASNTITHVLCYGASTGSVSVTATGGTPTYTGTGNMTGKAAGSYTFTVTDANGCTTTTSATVNQPATAVSASNTTTPVLCYGGSTGTVSVTATGGTGTYTGTGYFTGKSVGTYTYNVTDANGCMTSTSATVSQPAAPLSASNTTTPVLCYGGSTGTVSVTATGGTSPYTGTGNFTGKSVGTYTYNVTDANGCATSTTATVSQPASGLSVSNTVSNVVCYGGSTGSVSVTATGGTGSYTGTGNFTGKSAGTYTYVVTDANGCSAQTVATVGQPSMLVANKTVTNVSCYGMANGQVVVGATGGSPSYSGTGTFGPFGPGPYSYTVTDSHGCTSTVSGTITQPALLVASNSPNVLSTGFNLLCNKGNTGVVNVSATGGSTPYSNTGAHTGLYAGSFKFYVTDAHGCIDSTSGSLTQPPPFYINTSTSDDTICNGESVSLTGHPIDTVISTYKWLSNNGISQTISPSPVSAAPSTGIPTVTVGFVAIGYNGLGCPSEPDTVDVTVLPIGYFTGPNKVCTDYSVDLDNGTPGGVWYTPDTSYITLDQDGLVSATHEMVSGTYPTNTTITYTMPNGCYRTKVQTVNLTPKPIVGIATVCPASGLSLPAGIPSGGTWASSNANMTITMSGSGIATVNGISLGTANISYIMPTGCYVQKTFTVAPIDPITGPTQVCTGNSITLSHPLAGAQWSSSAPAFATIGIATGVVNGLSANTVTLTYKINPTCFATYTVTVNTTPANITGASTVCKSFNITLGNSTAGGTWMSDNTAAGTVGSTTGIVNGVDVGTANISYIMPTGCFSTKAITVNDNPASISGSDNICVSRTSPYTIATTGGSWSSSSSILGVNAGTGVANGVAAGNANISYTLSTGCYSFKAVTVAALPAAITGTTTMCEGGTTTLSSITPSLTWTSLTTSVATVAAATTTTGTVTGILAGTSTISYTSAAGCTQTINVTVYSAPDVIGGASNVCVGATSTYTNSVTGGTWACSPTSVAAVGSATGIVTGISGGSITLTYAMPGGCKAFKTVMIDALPAAITGTLSTCVGGTTTLSSATTGQTWSTASAAGSVDASTGVVTGLAAGTALISYTNAAGCTRTAAVNVSAGLPAIGGTSTICAGGTATLTCTTTGGTWSSSNPAFGSIVSTSGAITGVSAGTPNITYRTSPTCFTTTSVTVVSAPAAITGPSTSVCQNATLQLSNAVSGGVWSSSTVAKATVDAAGLVTGVTAGSSTISYAPAPGCVTTYLVSVNAIPNAITGTAIVCDSATTTLATTSTGGAWSSGSTGIATVGTSGIVTGIDPGTSTIKYTFPASGCFVSKDVTVNALPDAIVGDNSACVGLADTFTNNTPGGTWASSTTATATIGGTTGILSAVAAGTTKLSYTLSTGCRTTKVFTVNAIPATGITGTASICETATTTLNCTTAGLTWSSANTATATVAASTTTSAIVTGVSAGTAKISYTNAQGCARTVIVTVGVMPQAISGPNLGCSGRVDTFTNATSGGTWSSSAPSIATIGSATGYFMGLTGGNTTISYTIGGCRKTKVVTVNMQPGSISGPITICGANTTTLTATNPGGTWASSNTDVASVVSTSTTTGVVTGGATAGTAYISYTLIPGCARVLIVTVNATLPTITGPDAICVGTTGAYASGTGGTWISSNTAKAAIGFNTGIATGVNAGTTTISYKVHNNCFTVRNVTINAAVAAITGTTNVCVGATTTLACATTGGTWFSMSTATADVIDTSGVVTGIGAGTTLITYQVTATGCLKYTTVNVLAAPADIEGTFTLTTGTSTTLTNSTSGGTWSSSASTVASIGSTSGITNGVSLGSATITYKLTNGCYRTAMVTVVNIMTRPAGGTGVQDASVTSISIFPNPSQGNITIEAPASGTFMVFSMDGKQIAKYDVAAPATSITLPYDLAAGMYMCRFDGVDGSSSIVRLVYKP